MTRGRAAARVQGPVASVSLAFALALALAFACGAPRETGESSAASAPPSVQAGVVIEPPQLRVGDVAQIEVAVVTPPDHAVRPLALPEAATSGPLWVLEVEALPVTKRGLRWTHRTRLRVRAREVGSGTWPALTLEVVGPEGEPSTLRTEPRPFEVVSVLPVFPDRVTPFSLRLPETSAGLSPWVAAAGGATAALAGVGVVALVRRRRRYAAERARHRAASAARAVDAPWSAALAELTAAANASNSEWRCSADTIAVALRRYAGKRWGFAISCRSTEELAALAPPFALARRWPTALAWLRELDALRFRPGAANDAPEQVRHIAEAAARWIEETIPAESSR